MNLFRRSLRELAIWTKYPKDRIRWLFGKQTALDGRNFQLGGRQYAYFLHPYNRTWRNERSVEIPVVWEFLHGADPHRILEVGNVLSHYFDIGHCVIDKWETCYYYGNVINCDFLAWKAGRQFQHIVSTSTVEHIGWDEKPRNPSAVIEAFTKIQSLLVPDGTAMITVPIGQNPFLDSLLRDEKLPVAEAFFLKRMTAFNEWAEVDRKTALACSYGHPFPAANAVAFLLVRRKITII